MKNKLLKISTLFVFIAFCSYFLYQNDCFETSNHENVSTQKQTKIEKPILNTENKQLNLVAKHSNEADKNVTVIPVSKKNSVTQEISSVANSKKTDSIEEIREKYQNAIVNHPYRQRMSLPKKERKAMGLPPNAYNEQEWLYTMDPNLGRPTPEVTLDLQKTLDKQLETGRVPGDGLDNQWIERGPNNVGGRTRVLVFAPGSTTKVFAGAVSGGLWVNNDITNAASSWTQVSGVPSNMAVTCFQVWY